nr:MAG TPA: hypothetical protein [Caudoviricetes sp.]
MLKIGNEVRIRRKKDLLCEYSYNNQEDEPLRPKNSYLSFNPSMYIYCGEIHSITEIQDRGYGDTGEYTLNEITRWAWTEYMFETLDGKKL